MTDNDRHKHRKRNIIWFKPPFNSNVKTNNGRIILNLIHNHFNYTSILKIIFNINNIKVCYSCTIILEQYISHHNNIMLNKNLDNRDENNNIEKAIYC